MYDTDFNEVVQTIILPSEIYGITDVSSDGNLLMTKSAFGPGKLWLWNVETVELVQTLEVGYEITALAISTDGRYLASGDYFGQIILWNVDSE